MKNLKDQFAAQVAQTRQAKPEFMQKVDALIEQARAAEVGALATREGAAAPDFQLPDPQQRTVALRDLLSQGPVVLMFYRGSWCPYCNLQLRALQSRLAEIHELGAQLVAISPQMPDQSLTQVERDALEFVVLSDQDCRVASDYGVAWEVPEPLLEHMRKDRKLDLVDINGGNGSRLPIPATFVVGSDGRVAWRSVDVDYRTRAEPDDVLAAVRALHR
ncbi:peroxiredoxin-like family protein [Coraliomargarita sp. SDUM461003]|uniref:thioredoxin-dependent peroxiredoxin n=1 Tax=Thalassobacterium maritimum TaxID=3041265 RepID=A0ABU1AXY2_9BACT|nr:peroxiredoxin-like family protein [Coraliomargarita sp. SDUM461003]MDQ8208941.1 peroxiredoxin-like family protein [Coraliomargarita sp. SDUM461003]